MKRIFILLLLFAKVAVAQTESSPSAAQPLASPAPAEKQEEQIVKPVQTVEEKSPTRFFVGLHYSGANKMSFSDATFTFNTASLTGTYYGSIDSSMDTAVGITGGIQNLKKGNWGYIFSGSYSLERSINSTDMTIDGYYLPTFTYSNKPKITVMTLDGNLAFTFENDVYLVYGLNYSNINWKPSSDSTAKTVVQSALGYQFGFGVSLNKDFQLELLSKTIKTIVTDKNDELKIDYETGVIKGLQLTAKFLL